LADDRQITSAEIDVVRWLLASGSMKDVSEYSAESPLGARVVPGCQCGCASIDFVHAGAAEERGSCRGAAILAEAFTLWPDGARAGVILWGTKGILLGIELYELDPASNRFPTIESLCRWVDYFGTQGAGK
jgi:hypothetical protein